MSKPGGTPAAALGQQSFGQSYRSPMQQAAAMALQPKPGFNGGLANMGAQMLNGGGMNAAAMMPQIMQMFHGQQPQQPALGQSGGPDGTYGIGKPQGGAFGHAVQMAGVQKHPMNMPQSMFGSLGSTIQPGAQMPRPMNGLMNGAAGGFGSTINPGAQMPRDFSGMLKPGPMNMPPNMNFGSTIQPGAQMPRPNVSSLWMR